MIHNILPGIIGQLQGGACTPIQSVTEQIGSGTSNQSNAPFYGLYDYSVYAAIWEDTEFTGGSTTERNIQGIQFELAGYTTPYTYNNLSIYMAHCVEDVFPIGPAVDGSDLTLTDETLVWSGNYTISSNGFQSITLDTPFCYNGTSNLYVRFENRDGSWQSGFGWGEYAVAIDKAMYKFQDTTYPTGFGNEYNSRVNWKFEY
jgi:hypothetical protein